MIRKAVNSDLKEITRLGRIIQKMHVENVPDVFRMGEDASEFSDWMKRKLEEQESYIVVAEEGSGVVGYLYARETTIGGSWITKEGKFFHLEHIIVDPGIQRKGYGKLLMNAYVEEAGVRGIRSLSMDVWCFNQSAQRFFENLGFLPSRQTWCRNGR